MIFNRIKTAILLASLSGLLILAGNIIAGREGILIAVILSVFINFITYFYCDKIVINIYKAQKLDNQKYNHIYSMVNELATKSGVPMPKLWLIHNKMANAFATGRNPENGSIAVTTGILSLLSEKELRGVLAHEISHIKNRDILVSTVAATLATALSYIANMAYHMALWNTSFDRKKRINPFALIIVSILMPIAAMLIQMAISRSREYLADESGAETCHDPLSLAAALEKLHSHIPEDHLDNEDQAKASTAPLFIVHPFAAGTLSNLFSTHPPMQERVKRLKKMYEDLNRKKVKE